MSAPSRVADFAVSTMETFDRLPRSEQAAFGKRFAVAFGVFLIGGIASAALGDLDGWWVRLLNGVALLLSALAFGYVGYLLGSLRAGKSEVTS